MSASDIRPMLSHPRVKLESLERLARSLGCTPEPRNPRDIVWRRRLVVAIAKALGEEPQMEGASI